MRDRIIALLTASGFVHVDTNRWAFHGKLSDGEFSVGYSHKQWTVTHTGVLDNHVPAAKSVKRWRLADDERVQVPKDLLDLIKSYNNKTFSSIG